MIRFHTLRRQQWVSQPLDEVFAFFSDARNLEELTPPWLRFRILTPGVIRVGQGTELRYRLRVHGIPVYWRTQILRELSARLSRMQFGPLLEGEARRYASGSCCFPLVSPAADFPWRRR